MNIYEHFATYDVLPVRLRDVRDQILETGHVNRIIRVPVTFRDFIISGGFHRFRDLAPYASGQVVALIGYPDNLPEPLQRVIQVKEMLHVLDPDMATSPTKAKVDALIDDLMVEEAERAVGIPAQYDHRGLLHAMCILLPRGALDIIRPIYKRDGCTLDEVAEWANLPKPLVQIALRDSWRETIETI